MCCRFKVWGLEWLRNTEDPDDRRAWLAYLAAQGVKPRRTRESLPLQSAAAARKKTKRRPSRQKRQHEMDYRAAAIARALKVSVA